MIGDARLRRRRLVPNGEPRGADLVNSAHKLKCQSHKLRCYAPRRLGLEQNSMILRGSRLPVPLSDR